MKIDLPSQAFMRRFMPPNPAPEPEPERPLPKVFAWFEAYLGKLLVGQKFTVADAAARCGYKPKNVRVEISKALTRGMIERIVYVPGKMQRSWRRNGVRMDVSGIRQLGIEKIEAMPEGRLFCHRELPYLSYTSAHRAIHVAKTLGLIEAVGRVHRPETTYRKVKP